MLENIIFWLLDLPMLYPEYAAIAFCTTIAIIVAILTFPIDGDE